MIASAPGAIQLRQLQTMVEISAENRSTVIFPIPIQLLEAASAFADYASGQPMVKPTNEPPAAAD